jgi:hypothetical protein
MKHRLPVQRVPVEKSRFMVNETGTCIMCGKVHKFHPRIRSNWTVLEADSKPFYVCPDELPLKKQNPTEREFADAYEKIFKKIADLSQRPSKRNA